MAHLAKSDISRHLKARRRRPTPRSAAIRPEDHRRGGTGPPGGPPRPAGGGVPAAPIPATMPVRAGMGMPAGENKHMSATRSAVKSAPAARSTSELAQFVWEGTDKRGVKMKGEQSARNANMLRAELRRQGITPTVVKPKSKPLFGSAGKAIHP